MLEPIFYVNGVKIKQPINYQQLAIELRFDRTDPSFNGEVSTNQWTLGLGDEADGEDGAKLINDYITGGLTLSSPGVFEGIEFKIDLKDGNDIQSIFDGYLDLSEASVLCNRVEAKAVETGGVDWLNEVADSFTFEYLATSEVDGGIGSITQSDYVYVPYVISSIPDAQDVTILSLTTFVVARELIQVIKEVRAFAEAMVSDWLTFGNLVSLFFLIIQIGLLLSALISLINQILNNLIQPIKYQAGMFLNELCKKGAEHLGYTSFESSILDGSDGNGFERVLALPQSYEKEPNERNTSALSAVTDFIPDLFLGTTNPNDGSLLGYYKGTFGQFIREMKIMFNAKIVVDGSILRLERIDWDQSNDLYQLPPIDRANIPVRFNFSELYSYYSVSFTPDLNDKNSWLNWQGTELQVITAPELIKNQRNVLTKGEKVNRVSFSRGVKKTSLTTIEVLVKGILIRGDKLIGDVEKAVNFIIAPVNFVIKKAKKIVKQLNSIPPPLVGDLLPTLNISPIAPFDIPINLEDGANIDGRIGVLSLENDFINIPKLIAMKTTAIDNANPIKNKLADDNSTIIEAEYIYDKYHSINTFVGDSHKQYKIYTIDRVPFCIDDYNKVRTSNVIREADGITKGEIVSLSWNIYKQEASITYKVNEKYTDNLKQTKILSDGR